MRLLSLIIVMCLTMSLLLAGCGGDSSDTESTTEAIEETTTEETTTAEERYDSYAKYLSDFKEIDGGGYNATVSDELSGDCDFTELKNCALYTMKKAYAILQTRDMGVFGYYPDGISPAFGYDGSYGVNQVNIYREDWTSPEGWQWELSPEDWEYIEGK